MALKVKKSQLIAGTKITEPLIVPLDYEGEVQEVELTIRPLSSGEWAMVQDLMLGGQSLNIGLEPGAAGDSAEAMQAVASSIRMDVRAFLNSEHESDCLAASFGLSCAGERWTVRDVKELRPPGVERTIAQAVYDLTGVEPEGKAEASAARQEVEAQAESFRSGVREDDPGADDRPAAPVGAAAGSDAG